MSVRRLPPRGWGYRATGPKIENAKPPSGSGGVPEANPAPETKAGAVMGETQETYTLAEARRELAIQECARNGHCWDVIATHLGWKPVRIVCSTCGMSGAVTDVQGPSRDNPPAAPVDGSPDRGGNDD